MMSRGVFVTGTDTGIGKTLTSAILTSAWHATYWKPLQTGLNEEDGDSPTVKHLASLPAERLIPPAYALQAPLAPSAAADLEGIRINPGRLVLPDVNQPLVVEGAGGVMVPVTEDLLMIDIMARFALPVVIVARSGLGTINHSLLTIEALKRRGIEILGIVFSGDENPGNMRDIERIGQVQTLLSIPKIANITPQTISDYAKNVPALNNLLHRV
ncbi:dethiobiotin synthetase BioD [Neokomagataea thailandica NBRC 106555]|uniref:ATP-dependent dethiobiotin synthetase BioD n=2 Tax=Neokomagataea TaxID=1223423 RepID=A0A4Y6V905_9PROT|nr:MULTISPECIES: dethiobiotin synthase [Neokomagataea]QDH24855.1 dethiobiotin synthase [Neokomagataea tanensis]GBR50159.1 dethiobiotin synthetase BioD [Neokomagataea thailandica NBRC 106555]